MIDSWLVGRLALLCNSDSGLTTVDYESLLALHAVEFNQPLQVLNSPTYTRFSVGMEHLGSTTQIYLSGSTTLLTETTDYTLDYQRGILTTPATTYRPLSARGTAYNLLLAASDAWQRIASRYVLEFDVTGVEGSYKRSQQYDMCMRMADHYRRSAGVTESYVERGDMGGRLPNIDRIATG